ncbi:uncharacterized protein LOC132728916 [Ruditapes philippinarum]|uniref:uncharacterized protein LOC132728916 n=1 Tax=Ruditapes philippinarum TaxID=129788 RepID=UPI00295BB3AF|nr:uncharacterized protein LOC132728916 [Ruditapes philippinarum]
MPRSRNSRSASPQKSVSAESIAEIEQRKILQNVHDIFCEAIDADVIRLVLQECNWREEEAVDKLLVIAESREEQRKYKSKLHRIAEGIFGSLRSEDYGHSSVTSASSLSPSEKVIRRPSKPASGGDKGSSNTSKLHHVGPSEKLLARGLAPPIYTSGAQESGSSAVDEIEMDLHFAPTKLSETNISSASSSVSSQKSHTEQGKPPNSSKTVLLSQAQSAFNQQFDDAEGTQRWEQYKQKLSEHYLVTLTKDKPSTASKGKSSNKESYTDDPAILQAELQSPSSDKVVQKEAERPRSETSRSFPVRLLSRSPDTVEDDVPVPILISGQNAATRAGLSELMGSNNISNSELDETVFKCIYEVHGDLLDEKELGTLTKNSEGEKSSTPTSFRQTVISPAGKPAAQQSNEAMTLPTIGLSVDAVEFVPRPKSVTNKSALASPTEVKDPSPQPASKMPKSSSIEIKSGVKNVQRNQTTVSVGSPLTISPSISPGLSPPTTHMNSPVANLTGSPMFITPKWPQMFHTINHPPPMPPTVLATTTSRFMNPNHAHHLSPPGYRFPPAGPLPYSSRMVYSVAPPPLFRMAGVPRYVQQASLKVGDNMEDRAAIATGQPIMATSEASRLISPPALKLVNMSYIEQKVERIQTLQKSGVKVLVIVRGLPGSGKSTLARKLQLNGIVLSTDDYFMKGNIYTYNPDKLTEAHQWNRERSKEAMKMGKSPVIIDNTNTQTWEFKPYISMAVSNNYHIELMEPNTPWKYKANELARRTLHGVPKDQIERMCNRYEHNITVDTLLKKKKTDTKSNDNENTEGTRLDENTLTSQEDTSTNLSPITDIKAGKDLRLQNSSKVEDIRKQRSAESDSDSISSYHSGSLSNQSSRNASPKPLRPSLKTPGVLQQIEKRKPPVKKNPVSVKPTVKRVDRKAIQRMESNLSTETVQVVNEMVNEHVGDRILSIEDVTTLEEELKALLMLYPLNDSEVPSAEELIGLKLHDIINQSAEIPEADNDVEAETSDVESAKDISNDEIKFELPGTDEFSTTGDEYKSEKEFDESVNIEMVECDGKTCEILKGEKMKAIDIDLLKNGLHNESEAMQTDLKSNELVTTSSERNFPSWTEIASNETQKHSNTFIDMGKDMFIDSFGFIENESSSEDKICTDGSEFESQYWGNIAENDDDTPWDGNECGDWEGNSSNSNVTNGAKPQRKKRNRSMDLVSNEGNTSDNETVENNYDLLEGAFENENFVDCVEEINEKVQDVNSNCLNEDNDEDEVCESKNEMDICTTNIAERVADRDNEENNFVVEKTAEENSNNEEIICSSVDTNGSQDSFHVTSHNNSSLQMLKESYIDAESAIQTVSSDKEEEMGPNNVVESVHVSANDSESIKIDNDVDSELLSDKKSNCDNSEEIEKKSNKNVKMFQDNGEALKDVKSNKSLTPSEDSVKEVEVRNESEKEGSSLASQNLVNSLPQKSKKPSRRKMAANLMGPFLNREDKEKFKTEAWNSFPIHSVEKPASSATSFTPSKLPNERDVISVMTMTDIEYFNTVLRLNQGGFVDSSIKYLNGNPRKLINGLNTNVELNSVNEIHTLEKSTSTEDLLTMTDSESVEFLHTCFPTVPKAELECVLENCANNCEWAINLLLDWKYSLHLTTDEKRKFTDSMAEVKKGSSQGMTEQDDSKSDSGPNSLLDICFNLVEQQKIASREEIEKQLIQTGKERLDRIEDDNITKIRLHRSTSLSESSFDIGSLTPKRNDLSVFRSNSSPAQITEGGQEDDNDTSDARVNENKLEEFKSDRDNNDDGLRSSSVDRNSGADSETVHKVKKAGSNTSNDVDVTDMMDNHVAAEEFDLDIKPAVSINIDTEMIGRLEDIFGPLWNRSDTKDDISVPLDRKTAWMLYQCVKKGIILTRSQQRREQQQLIKDEELARQLQEEENAYIKPGNQNQIEDNVPRGRKATPLVGLSVVGTIPQHKEPVAWNRGKQTLAEIMQEEKRIQESQKEFVRLLEKEGGPTAMATCLKRQKLYGRFPTLDKKLLDEIFQANCFNLSETIDSIASSLGEGHMGTTSVTMATDQKVQDEKLLEATKQQSMQEMLDSYIYHPVVSKDYQDGMEPEYEDYRGEANLHFRLRHECFQKAREAHRRGLKQVASFYSQQGHQHTQKIKEANMRASEYILAERNHDIVKNTLDLHGLHVDEAMAALNRIIPEKERDHCKKLTIITGRGSHSRGGVARLRPSVIAFLNAHKYSYTELQTGVFNVSLKKYRSPDK